MEKLTVTSKIGFWLGDVAAVLPESDGPTRYMSKTGFDTIPTEANLDGIYCDRVAGGEFAACRTGMTQGAFRDADNFVFEIVAGMFAVIPLEMISEARFNLSYDMGRIWIGAGDATMEEANGIITVTLPGEKRVVVNTNKSII